MASLSLPIPVEPRTPRLKPANGTATTKPILLVAGFGDCTAADYATFVSRRTSLPLAVVADHITCRHIAPPAQLYPLGGPDEFTFRSSSGGRIASLVVFLPYRLTDADKAALDNLLSLADESRAESVILVTSASVHLHDPEALAVEAYAYNRAKGARPRTVVLRAGHVVSPHSYVGTGLRLFGACFPLVPSRLTSCAVTSEELFTLIESLREAPRTRRVYTLLGPNRPWRDLLAEHRSRSAFGLCLMVVCAALSCLMIGQVAALVFAVVTRFKPVLRKWNYSTLRPRSLRELLGLVNGYNRRYVKVVGYNNGVNHFGHRYPGQTIVSTVDCNRVRHANADTIFADCGVTVRLALDYLAGSGQELYVIPNYSYVCLGTAFFVPIHGSAADFSTVADTITAALFYDPAADRLIKTQRDDPFFRDLVYNLKADVLLVQLQLRVKAKARYFLRKQELEDPAADTLLDAFQDNAAANVEVRKSSAGDKRVQLYKYYNQAEDSGSRVLELPRDRLGRLWDRLEENPLTSFLMHALTRHFAWHVELFFTSDEFRTFWKTHRELPLRKIQLRYIRQDGFPQSPFRDHDCISADLFMFRRHRRRFEAYLKQTFAVIRSNPGKHSR